ncbi:hypothetical protein PybrP1_013196 [[Pythium] brassicae (nom. inval.)]|nr:hypothetical protein PybrP1_013196 [[Pythium] brassicae (nom. inval.)]
MSASYVALVLGSTGAVGRDLVAELVASSKCAKVIALTRRDVPEAAWRETFPALDVAQAHGKLEVRTVDFEQLAASEVVIHREEKVDAAFSCLGTTRKAAGSAEAFRKVDLEYTTHFGEAAKAAGVPFFGLLTSAGANKNSWFLYPQTKGEVEENVKQMGFARTSVYRPGLIDRGDLMRTMETLGSYLLPSITTRAIARAMVADYESGAAGVKEWTNAELKKFEPEKAAKTAKTQQPGEL